MPPRPRPRPRTVLAPSSPVSACQTSTSILARKSAAEEEDNDDDLFIRSKGRSLREVHTRVARAYLAYLCYEHVT